MRHWQCTCGRWTRSEVDDFSATNPVRTKKLTFVDDTGNILRAKRSVSNWPKWKQDVDLTFPSVFGAEERCGARG